MRSRSIPTTARLLLRSLVEDDDLALAEPPEAAAVEARIARAGGALQRAARRRRRDRRAPAVSAPDAVQTLIGASVYHFASGEFGEAVLGGPLFSAEAVARRKREVKELLLHGLASPSRASKGKPVMKKLLADHRKSLGNVEVIEFVDEAEIAAPPRQDRHRRAARGPLDLGVRQRGRGAPPRSTRRARSRSGTRRPTSTGRSPSARTTGC